MAAPRSRAKIPDHEPRCVFPYVAGQEICEVTVAPSNRLIFDNGDKRQDFFIRANYQTLPLSMEESGQK